MAAMVGYSATPLWKKLGVTAGSRVWTQNAPAEYAAWIEPLPPNAKVSARLRASVDIAHLFVDRRRELLRLLTIAMERVGPHGAIWVSWPKKASRVPTDMTEDVIREVALPLGLVDIKVCAVSEVWSGLKLVVRKELR